MDSVGFYKKRTHPPLEQYITWTIRQPNTQLSKLILYSSLREGRPSIHWTVTVIFLDQPHLTTRTTANVARILIPSHQGKIWKWGYFLNYCLMCNIYFVNYDYQIKKNILNMFSYVAISNTVAKNVICLVNNYSYYFIYTSVSDKPNQPHIALNIKITLL